LTFWDVSDVSGELLIMGLFCGAPLPVVIAEPELAPEFIELPAGLAFFTADPDFPGTLAPAPDAPVCASANVELRARARADAKATVISFMVCPFIEDRTTEIWLQRSRNGACLVTRLVKPAT
jgi:hypothetical protein